MRKIRFIALILTVLMFVGVFAACGKEEDDNPSTTQSNAPVSTGEPASGTDGSEDGSTASAESSEEEISRGPLDHIETQYLDRDVVFLVENNNGSGYGSREICPFEDSPIAIYVSERNDLVEEKLGITIKERRTDTMVNDLRNAALTVPDFDIAMPYMTSAGPLITENLFYDLYEFDDIINFDAPYWDKNAEESLSIGNKLYLTTGDFSVLTLDVTHCMLFNKTIVSNNNLDNPYELVEQKKWTLDKMLSMTKEVTNNTDGVDGIQYTDTVGLLINTNYSNSLFIGAGLSFAGKDKDGVPSLQLYNTQSVAVCDKIYEIFTDNAVLNIESFNPQAISDGFTNCYWAARDRLGNDGALFVTISLSDVLNMAQYKDTCDFGLLVTPKFTEEQDRYYSYISIIFATGCVIPTSNPEPRVAALTLEALAAASTNTVKFNYYDRVLKLQKFQDEESEKMLDFIFDNRVYDIGALYNWGGLRDFVSKALVGTSANLFTSNYQSQESVIESAMQDTVDFFTD